MKMTAKIDSITLIENRIETCQFCLEKLQTQ